MKIINQLQKKSKDEIISHFLLLTPVSSFTAFLVKQVAT